LSTWKKLILSGSKAQVQSLEIQTPPEIETSLEVNGFVDFDLNSLPQVQGDYPPEGTLMRTTSNTDWVCVSNPLVIVPEYPLIIPPNEQGFDFNGDGEIGSADLLGFLIAYGTANGESGYDPNFDFNGDGEIGSADLLGFLIAYGTANGESGYDPNFDFNGDGEIGSADLLGFLIDYGETTADLYDSRPSINWSDPSYNWLDSNNVATVASVTTRYNAINTANSSDVAFWEMLPSEVNGDGTPDVDYNVKAYLEQTGYTASIELFTYVYFTQYTGGPWGGIDAYTTESISGVYP
tara:strand:- start:3051 stop:3932 length:882 start_codon:yes stop_codon:yes gene_type:complete